MNMSKLVKKSLEQGADIEHLLTTSVAHETKTVDDKDPEDTSDVKDTEQTEPEPKADASSCVMGCKMSTGFKKAVKKDWKKAAVEAAKKALEAAFPDECYNCGTRDDQIEYCEWYKCLLCTSCKH
jgi:hypothetical protein